jgi:hypothetical protein
MLGEWGVRSTLLSVFIVSLLLLTSIGTAAGRTTATAPSCSQATPFDLKNFPHPPKIDNQWFPLVPGTQFVLEGRANRGGGPLPHRVVTTVTDLTKVINGVRTVVIWEQDLNENQLQEAELAFEAQDNAGNVWNFGEYPEEYEDGKFTGAPNTWIVGQARAEAGTAMLAQPKEGTPEYLQGSAPEIKFLDCAKVFAVGQKTCVPLGCYENVLVTDEHSPLDPESGHQRKYYAPRVGNVQVAAVEDPEGETLVLTQLTHLSPDALAAARQEALKLEKHAYEIAAVYRQTPPAEQAPVVKPSVGQEAQAGPNQRSTPQAEAHPGERSTVSSGLPAPRLLLVGAAVAVLLGGLLLLRRRAAG